MIMSDVNDDTLAEMDGLVAEGVPDFKLFTAHPGVFYSDDKRSSGRCNRPPGTAG
jgi:dihydropyrimidinase